MRSVDIAWEKLFDKYDILSHIERDGTFSITANDMKSVILPSSERGVPERSIEPRLITKFDCKGQLPKAMVDNHISILPSSNGTYILGKFETFKEFPNSESKIISMRYPDWMESIDFEDITSESTAIAAAKAACIYGDFLDDIYLQPTVSGRLRCKDFSFSIGNTNIEVVGPQMEIDYSFESPKQYAIIEGKNVVHDDFMVRQLYYPYRHFYDRGLGKPIRTLFSIYSNGIYRILEYGFESPYKYDSCILIKEKRYTFDTTTISRNDVKNVVDKTTPNDECYGAPFIQCDSFDKIINILELIESEGSITKDDITEMFGFTERQSDYYFNGCRYIGLVQINSKKITLTERAKPLITMTHRDRCLKLVEFISEHSIFNELLSLILVSDEFPSDSKIQQIMSQNRVCSDNLIARRSQTVKAWLKWIICLYKNER